MERPSQARVETLRGRLGDIVEEGTPTQPQVIGSLAQTIQHHQGMGEIILMPDPLLGLHALQGAKLGEDQGQQSAFIQQVETDRGLWREDDLVQLVHDTLLGDNGDTLPVTDDSVEGIGIDKET